MKRRSFLKTMIAAPTVAALAGRLDAAPTPAERTLIVVELRGGNDLLNTVVPREDDDYFRARPRLAVPREKLTPLDDLQAVEEEVMGHLLRRYRSGDVVFIGNVGHPFPDRSHFRCRDILHAASPTLTKEGWLARALAAGGDDISLAAVSVGDGPIPAALAGGTAPVAALGSRGHPVYAGDAAAYAAVADDAAADGPHAVWLAESARAAHAVASALEGIRPARGLPGGPLDRDMRCAAELVASDCRPRVIYVRSEGWDTHADQRSVQRDRLFVLNRSLDDLHAHLAARRMTSSVTILVITEFGRRVAENGSGGTDHGKAGGAIVIGDGVRGGLRGGPPDLKDLDDGDLRHGVDFRDLYAEVTEDWLGTASGDWTDAVAKPKLGLFE